MIKKNTENKIVLKVLPETEVDTNNEVQIDLETERNDGVMDVEMEEGDKKERHSTITSEDERLLDASDDLSHLQSGAPYLPFASSIPPIQMIDTNNDELHYADDSRDSENRSS